MSEAGDFKPAPHWNGFKVEPGNVASKKGTSVGRTYADAKAANIGVMECVPPQITTDSESPLVFVLDDSGSMGPWPATIKGKFAYLEHEAKEYLGESMRVAFAFVGDAFSDSYPLQVRGFLDGKDWPSVLGKTDQDGNPIPPDNDEEKKKLLILEGGGGGTGEESYDIAALYFARNCHMPNAIRKPILIFIGDEGIYSFVDRQAAKEWAHCDIDGRLSPRQVFDELKAKFSVYIIRKPYGSAIGNQRSATDVAIQKQWEDMLGVDHVASLPNAERVVDVVFGFLAKETNRAEYFEDELRDRQGKDEDGLEKIEIVLDSVSHIMSTDPKAASGNPIPKAASGNSISKASGGPNSISLLDLSEEELDDLGNW